MQSAAATINDYLNEIPEDRKTAFLKLRETILENLPKGFKEEIEKRKQKKKLFGLIDIGDYNPTTIMVVITLAVVGIMTCFRYKNKIN